MPPLFDYVKSKSGEGGGGGGGAPDVAVGTFTFDPGFTGPFSIQLDPGFEVSEVFIRAGVELISGFGSAPPIHIRQGVAPLTDLPVSVGFFRQAAGESVFATITAFNAGPAGSISGTVTSNTLTATTSWPAMGFRKSEPGGGSGSFNLVSGDNQQFSPPSVPLQNEQYTGRFNDPSGLIIRQFNLAIAASSIVSESAITNDNPGIFSAGPSFATDPGTGFRVVQWTFAPGPDGAVANLSWTWNGVPFELELTRQTF